MNLKKTIILGITVLFLTACSSPTTADSNVAGPVFVSEQGLFHDWGNINIMGGNVTKSFTLTNNNPNSLLLTGAVTSCMCTSAQFTLKDNSKSPVFGMHENATWTYEVQPNESFEVNVIFDPLAHGPSATGPVQRIVNVISDPDPSVKGVTYTSLDLRGNVLPEATFKK